MNKANLVLKYLKGLFKREPIHQISIGDTIYYRESNETYPATVIGMVDQSVLIIQYTINGVKVIKTLDSADIATAN